MRIVGVEIGGAAPLFSFPLRHGDDPHQVAWEHGFRVLRPLSVSGTDHDMTVTLQVTRHRRPVTPRGPQKTRVTGSAEAIDATPAIHQRLAAYAIVLSRRGLLATEFSDKTAVPGLWSLPGGGIDPGETPAQAIAREALEETGQDVEVRQFLDLQTDHWIGLSPGGVLEDFHAVRLVYAAWCPEPTDPVVHDVGGTTADCRWIPVERWHDVPWATGTRHLLAQHLALQARLWRQAHR